MFLMFLCLCILAQTAEASLKTDISKVVGKVTTTVSGWLETAKKQMDESETLQTMISYGKGAIETAKKLKELQSSVGNAVSAANDMAGAATDLANDAMNTALDTTAGVVGDALAQTGDAQELLELKGQKVALETERDDAIAAAQEELNGKISLAEENIAKLQTMIEQEPDKKTEYEAQIADYETQIENYQKELENVSNTVSEQYQSQIAAIDDQITALRDEAIAQAGSKAAEKLGSLLGGDDDETAVAMNDMIKNNFLEKDAEETIENITPIKVYRKLTAANDTLSAFNRAWTVKKTRYDNDKNAENVQSEVPQMDGSSSSLGMDIQLKVENINALLIYTRMMVEDLKMRTANELNNLPNTWHLTRYDKDVTEFNLDDYVFDGKSKAEKLLDIAKDIKDKGIQQTASDMLDKETETETEENTDSATGNTTTTDPLESVTSELKKARAGSGDYEGVDEAGAQEDISPVNVTEELNEARSKAAGE